MDNIYLNFPLPLQIVGGENNCTGYMIVAIKYKKAFLKESAYDGFLSDNYYDFQIPAYSHAAFHNALP
jgi:hypothetical protein